MKMKVAIPLVVTAALGALYLQLRSFEKQISQRFPLVDPMIAKKAYRKLFKDAVKQKIDISDLDDLEMDELFLTYVEKVS